MESPPPVKRTMSEASTRKKRFRRSNENEANINERYEDPDETPLFGSPAPPTLPKKYKCNYCNERFRSRSNLTLHAFIHSVHRRQQNIKTSTPNIRGQYKCRRCHRSYKSKALRNEHEYIRHQYPLICTSCHKRYAQVRHLIRHVQIRHPEEIQGEFNAVVSPQSAVRAALAVPDELELLGSPEKSLSLSPPPPSPPHLKEPNNVLPTSNTDMNNPDCNFEAQISRANEIFKKAKAASEPVVIRRHVRKRKSSKGSTGTGTESKRYQCDLCPNDYAFKSYMEKHRRTHFEDFPCKCQYCGRGFTVYANLKTHMRVHTGEKPYECSVCKKKFSQKPNMTNHMRRAHNQQSK